MSQHSLFLAWVAGCFDHGGYGVSSGDSWHRGMRYYDEPFPCPNGHVHLQKTYAQIRELPPMKAMLDKARADIARHKAEFADRE